MAEAAAGGGGGEERGSSAETGCMLADVQEIRLETSYWLSGRPGRSLGRCVVSSLPARSCAKFRQSAHPPVPSSSASSSSSSSSSSTSSFSSSSTRFCPTDRSFSPDISCPDHPTPYPLTIPPPFRPAVPTAPAYIRVFLFLRAAAVQPLVAASLHRSPLRLQLISLVLGRPFSNFEFLR
jgi:hypothetical protein